MADQVKLTKTQMAALDLLIARSQESDFIDAVGNIADNVAKVTVAAVAVTAVVAGDQPAAGVLEGDVSQSLKGLTVDDLLAVRKKAVLK